MISLSGFRAALDEPLLNYALGVLVATLVCWIDSKVFPPKPPEPPPRRGRYG